MVVMDLANKPCFRFIGMSVVIDLAIGLGRAESLAIGGAVSTKADVAIGFFELSLW